MGKAYDVINFYIGWGKHMSYQRILILSSKFGGGHYNAGQALVEEFGIRSSEQTEVRHIDFGSFFYRKTDYMIRKAYLSIVKKTPGLYGKIFDKTADITAESCSKFVRGFVYRDFLGYIEEFNPDVIVNTHFLTAGILAEFKSKGLLDVPIVTVVTDYMVHGIWAHSGIDLYLVGCKEAYSWLIKRGINPERISISGIPIRVCFHRPLSMNLARKKLGLDTEKSTVLIMGGSEGFSGKVEDIEKVLFSVHQDVQFLLVCGSDEEAYKDLSSYSVNLNKKILVYKYIDNVHELMAASDFLITKGGGLTISEALTVGLPIVMYKPIPGHENGNAVFVEKAGAGIIVNKVKELVEVTNSLLTKPERLKDMSMMARKILPENSSRKAVKSIIRQVHLRRVKRYNSEDWRIGIV